MFDQDNQKNLLLAIVLSVSVLLAWQVFYAGPKLKEDQERRQRIQQEQQQQAQPKAEPGAPKTAPQASPGTAPQPAAQPGAAPTAVPGVPSATREAALADSPRLKIDTPSLRGSIALKGGRIDDLVLVKYREDGGAHEPQRRAVLAVRRARALLRRVRLGAGQRSQYETTRQRHALAPRRARHADARHAGNAGVGQRAGPRLPPQDLGRRRLSLHRRRRGREQEQGRGHSLSLLPHLAARHAQDAGLLHPARGTDRRIGRCRPAGAQLCRPAQGRRHEDLQADGRRRLAGPDRQILGRSSDPRPEDAVSGDVQRHQGRQGPLSDRLPAQQRRHRPTRKPQQRDGEQPVRRRQAGDRDRGLQGEARRQAVRSADRLGLVLFHHQAAVQTAALAEPAVRQLRAGRPGHHRSRQGCLLPVGQQELRIRWPR